MQLIPESSLTPRLLMRATLLAQDHLYWRDVFDHARVMGHLLHAARQQLDVRSHLAPIDEVTLRLWEWGLALPDEIAAGLLTHITRWYIDQLRQQRPAAPRERLAYDSIALVAELVQQDDWGQLGLGLHQD